MLKFLMKLACMVMLATSATAQTNLNDRFDARDLTRVEKRILQAALAVEGHYNSVLDGEWGRGSEGAMSAMARERHNRNAASNGHVAQMLARLQDEVRARDWRPFSPDFSDVSVLAPMGMMEFQRSRRGQALYTTPKGLQIRFLPQNLGQALTLANAVAQRHVGSGQAYQSLKGDRLVVSAETENGGGAYLRTSESNNRITAVLVEWTRAEAKRAALVIASISHRAQASLDIPRGSTLQRLTDFSFSADNTRSRENTRTEDGFWPNVVTQAKPDPARPQKPAQRTTPVGLAFYINNTDLLTSSNVARACQNPVFADGRPARVVALDASKDLAVLTSDQRSTEWIDISVSFPDRGTDVILVGYGPGDAKKGDRLGADQVSVESRASRKSLVGKVLLRENSKWADHGSPVLDTDRKLAGIVIQHPKNSRRTPHIFVASSKYLRPFLEENNVIYRRAGRKPREITQAALSATINQIHCPTR